MGRRFGRDLQIRELLCGHDIYKEDVLILSVSMAKRLLDKVSIETNPSTKADDLDCVKDRPTALDMDAKQSSDVNVTVRSRSSNRVEQITVESGNEDIGSSMHRIGLNLLHVVLCDHSSKKEATTMEFPAFIACGTV